MGQHFLRSPEIAELIVRNAEVGPQDTVLEIGPGMGALTKALLEHAGHVIAVEKDARLAEYMRSHFLSEKLTVIEGDILATDLSKILPARYKVVANIPYYITAKIFRLFLEPSGTLARPQKIVLMVQHEVAQRLTASPPHMNVLGISVQAYGKARLIKKIPRSFFKPQPDVDSAIVLVEDIGDDFFVRSNVAPADFFALVKKAFGGKRKKLKNTIGIKRDERPQELSLAEWINIVKEKSPTDRTRKS